MEQSCHRLWRGPAKAGKTVNYMWFTYIIKSQNFNKYYVGYTEDLNRRIKEHNSGKTKSIVAYVPYELVYSEEYSLKSDARKRELQIKRYKGGNAFKKLIQV